MDFLTRILRRLAASWSKPRGWDRGTPATFDQVAEVRVDAAGRLCVKPATQSFEHIGRTAREIRRDEAGRFLHSPVPREWSHARWFQQVVTAVASEYGCSLVITLRTRWVGVDAAQ